MTTRSTFYNSRSLSYPKTHKFASGQTLHTTNTLVTMPPNTKRKSTRKGTPTNKAANQTKSLPPVNFISHLEVDALDGVDLSRWFTEDRAFANDWPNHNFEEEWFIMDSKTSEQKRKRKAKDEPGRIDTWSTDSDSRDSLDFAFLSTSASTSPCHSDENTTYVDYKEEADSDEFIESVIRMHSFLSGEEDGLNANEIDLTCRETQLEDTNIEDNGGRMNISKISFAELVAKKYDHTGARTRLKISVQGVPGECFSYKHDKNGKPEPSYVNHYNNACL